MTGIKNEKGTVRDYSSFANNTSLGARVYNSHQEYQELADFSSTGRKRPWKEKKNNSLLVAESFSRISKIYPESSEFYTKKASKIDGCGNYLEFKRFTDNSLKLKQAFFCKQRLCPMCNWRRSLKIFSQVSKIMDSIEKDNDNDYDYLFLTLTIRNVDGPELNDAITELIKGFYRLIRRLKSNNNILGSFRALEVTYNEEFGNFHPHLHIVLCVNKRYFKENYISQNEWSELWKKSMNLDYKPIVHIEKIKGDKKAAVAEAAKYATKEEDLFTMDEESRKIANDEIIFTLDEALKGRRLIGFTGIFKDYQKKLKLDDSEDGDLIHIDDDSLRPELEYVIETYNWRSGAYLSRNVNTDTA